MLPPILYVQGEPQEIVPLDVEERNEPYQPQIEHEQEEEPEDSDTGDQVSEYESSDSDSDAEPPNDDGNANPVSDTCTRSGRRIIFNRAYRDYIT